MTPFLNPLAQRSRGLLLRGCFFRAAACAVLLSTTGCGSSLFHRTPKDNPSAAKDKDDKRKITDAPPAKINPITHFAAGQVHERENHLLAAADQYRRAIAADPKYVMAYNRLGIVCQRLKMHPEADEAFEKAIGLAPTAAFLHNNLAYARMMQGDYARAEASLRDALRLDASYKKARMNLGVVLARTRRTTEAVEQFGLVVPHDVAYYNVAVLAVADGRFDEARGAFEQVVALNPDASDAKRQLVRLRQLQVNPSESLKVELASAAERLIGNFGPPVPSPVVFATPSTRPAVAARPQPGAQAASPTAGADDDFEP